MSLFTSADLASFKADRLLVAAQNLLPGVTLSDDFLLQQLQAAEADIGRRLRVFLEPTRIFCHPPSEAEIASLAGLPWAEEPGYDYDPTFFQADRWGFIILRQHPVVSITSIQLAYPNPASAIFSIPNDWIRVDKKSGQVRLIPAAMASGLPLSAFILQAFGGGSTIPYMVDVEYTAGLSGVKTDPAWADLLDVILKQAVLSIVDGAYIPQSGSISADGLSQSIGFDIQKYRETVDYKLMGPKGSNGGLWTSIHGMGLGVMGVF